MIHTISPLTDEETSLCNSNFTRDLIKGDPSSAVFFDIETTGLSPETAYIFLIGCICYDGRTWQLHQFLIQYVQEEKSLLQSFFSLAQNYEILIHYNGHTFDLPFLRKRAQECQIATEVPDMPNIDLYQRYRSMKTVFSLQHLNQRSLEEWLGWNRSDEIESKEMINLYWTYSVSADPEIEKLLLLHNHDDLTGMLRILSLEAYLALKRGEIQNSIDASESSDHSELLLQFQTELLLPKPYTYLDKITVNGSEGLIRITFTSGTLKHFFPDYKNYYFLPMEQKAVHKSVASFVDKNFREPARPDNCYAEKTGLFLPQPEAIFTPAFRKDYDSKKLFFSYDKEFCEKKQDLYTYVQALLIHLNLS